MKGDQLQHNHAPHTCLHRTVESSTHHVLSHNKSEITDITVNLITRYGHLLGKVDRGPLVSRPLSHVKARFINYHQKYTQPRIRLKEMQLFPMFFVEQTGFSIVIVSNLGLFRLANPGQCNITTFLTSMSYRIWTSTPPVPASPPPQLTPVGCEQVPEIIQDQDPHYLESEKDALGWPQQMFC